MRIGKSSRHVLKILAWWLLVAPYMPACWWHMQPVAHLHDSARTFFSWCICSGSWRCLFRSIQGQTKLRCSSHPLFATTENREVSWKAGIYICQIPHQILLSNTVIGFFDSGLNSLVALCFEQVESPNPASIPKTNRYSWQQKQADS